MPQAFISYAQADSDVARRLELQLRELGVRTWLDRDQIPPGEAWPEHIQKELKNSDLVFVVSSPNANRSQHVAAEVAVALSEAGERGTRIVPVLRDADSRPPFLLEHLQALSMLDEGKLHDQLKALVEAVRRGRAPIEDLGAQLSYLKASREALTKQEELLLSSQERKYSRISAGLTVAGAIAAALSSSFALFFANLWHAGPSQSQTQWESPLLLHAHRWLVPFLAGILVGVFLSAAFFVVRQSLRRRQSSLTDGARP